jgi:hypothetical protein
MCVRISDWESRISMQYYIHKVVAGKSAFGLCGCPFGHGREPQQLTTFNIAKRIFLPSFFARCFLSPFTPLRYCIHCASHYKEYPMHFAAERCENIWPSRSQVKTMKSNQEF